MSHKNEKSKSIEQGRIEVVSYSPRALAVAGWWTDHILRNVTGRIPEAGLSLEEILTDQVNGETWGSPYSRDIALTIPERQIQIREAVEQNAGIFRSTLASVLDANRPEAEEMLRNMGTDKYDGLRRPHNPQQQTLANIAFHTGIPHEAFPLGMSTFTDGYGWDAMIRGRTHIGVSNDKADIVFPIPTTQLPSA